MSEVLKGINDKALTANGYQKLPGGMIIQWGTFNAYTWIAIGY